VDQLAGRFLHGCGKRQKNADTSFHLIKKLQIGISQCLQKWQNVYLNVPVFCKIEKIVLLN
jgi:hypothetical protein